MSAPAMTDVARLETADLRRYIAQLESELREAREACTRSRHNEERLMKVLNTLDDLMFEVDADGRYLNVWTGRDDKLVVPRDEVCRKTMLEVFGPEEGRRYVELVRRVIETGHSEVVNYSIMQEGECRSYSAILTRIGADSDNHATVCCLVRDVTDRARAEASLRESQQRLAEAEQVGHTGHWYWDLATDSLTLSPGACALYGISPDAGRQSFRQLLDIVHPDDQPRIRALTEQALRELRAIPVEFRIIRRDGAVRTLECNGSVILDASGSFTAMMGSLVDVTDRKHAENILRERETYLRAIIDHEPECVKTIALDGTLQNINRAGLKITESDSVSDVVGKNIFSLIHSDDRPAFEALHRSVVAGQSGTLTFRIVGLRGTVRWVETHAVPLRDAAAAVRSVLSVTRDITQRRRAEEALRLSEERFRALYEDTPAMYFTVDRAGTVLSVNGFGATQLGYSVEELVGSPVTIVFHPEDRVQASANLAHAFLEPMQISCWELRKQKKNGVVMWVRETVRIVRDPSASPTALIVCEDITDRKLHEDELARTTQKLQALVSACPVPIATVDTEGRVTSWNPAAEATFGWSEAEVLTRELPYVPPGKEAEAEAIWEQAVREHGVRGLEVERMRKDGSLLYLQIWSAPICNPDGTVREWIGLMLDVTVRKHAEEALQAGEERFRRIFEDAPIGMCILNPDMSVRKFNRAFQRLTGYEDDEILGRSYALYSDPDERSRMILPTDRKLSPNFSMYSIEQRYIRKDGRLLWVNLTASPLTFPGEDHQLILAVVEDVTDRKRAEQELHRIFEERVRISQDLHDSILQSLYAVGMGVEAAKLLLRKAPGEASRQLDRSVEQMNKVVHEVRDFIPRLRSQPGAEISVEDGLRSIAASVSGARPDLFAIRVDAAAAAGISHDEKIQLFNIAKEAISNSIRHGRPSSGVVSLRPWRHMVRFEVRDNGKGFDPKRPAHQGMGLDNIASRAQKLGGKLRIHSRRGEGTRIVIDLPGKGMP